MGVLAHEQTMLRGSNRAAHNTAWALHNPWALKCSLRTSWESRRVQVLKLKGFCCPKLFPVHKDTQSLQVDNIWGQHSAAHQRPLQHNNRVEGSVPPQQEEIPSAAMQTDRSMIPFIRIARFQSFRVDFPARCTNSLGLMRCPSNCRRSAASVW